MLQEAPTDVPRMADTAADLVQMVSPRSALLASRTCTVYSVPSSLF